MTHKVKVNPIKAHITTNETVTKRDTVIKSDAPPSISESTTHFKLSKFVTKQNSNKNNKFKTLPAKSKFEIFKPEVPVAPLSTNVESEARRKLGSFGNPPHVPMVKKRSSLERASPESSADNSGRFRLDRL